MCSIHEAFRRQKICITIYKHKKDCRKHVNLLKVKHESEKIARRVLLSACIYETAISHGMPRAGGCQREKDDSEQGRFCIF